jgi:hypothetical protein
MKPAITRTHAEIIIGSVATIFTGAMCCYGSVTFRSIYAYMYGDEKTFELLTRIAFAAKLWCPVLLGIGLAIFVRRVMRAPQTRVALASLFAMNLLCTLFVVYGLVAPLFQTTFRMSK